MTLKLFVKLKKHRHYNIEKQLFNKRLVPLFVWKRWHLLWRLKSISSSRFRPKELATARQVEINDNDEKIAQDDEKDFEELFGDLVEMLAILLVTAGSSLARMMMIHDTVER